ncbi:MAG TPA: hypothetical protein VKY74_14645 [Chloroflexia bacterium]|nr:hypothetical protein [Chloroflexia bacterium]
MALTLPDFIARWQASTRSEKSPAQEPFLDLCAVLGQPPPAQADATATANRRTACARSRCVTARPGAG